jgi:peptide-methionine (R)-S-oxide reductase
MMNKRTFLKNGSVMLSTAWLFPDLLWRSTLMATANNNYEINKTEQEWKQVLTPEQFQVLRQHGTERAGTSPLDKEYGKGTYTCAGCDLPVFTSDTKFNSGTGWPSFYQRAVRF